MRLPIAAGKFYPANKTKLKNIIKEKLKRADRVVAKPKILILPHAGYRFCADVMAAGLKQAENKEINKIILIGPSHQPFEGICFYKNGNWKTPLGEVNIDLDYIKKIQKQSNFSFDSVIHKYEHSIEVLIPFLQVVFNKLKIIPVLIGDSSIKEKESLASLIKQNIDNNTLVIISSDLSHYPEKEIAEKEDKKTLDSITKGLEAFKERLKEEKKKVDTYACGKEAIEVALILKEKLDLNNSHIIKYHNSGDITKNSMRVVGYGAISFN